MEQMINGVFLASGRGFGFVAAAGGDVYIPAHVTGTAMHKDEVTCRILPAHGDDRRTGAVVRVLRRGYQVVVGVYQRERSHGIVTPDERKLGKAVWIPKGKNNGATDGCKVVVRITRPPAAEQIPAGEVVEVLGHVNAPGVDVLSVLRQMELPVAFSEPALTEAAAVPQQVFARDRAGRADLRGLPLITIDGEDTKDIDDAVSLKRLQDGRYELGVHIADVSHYVREGSALDKEAYARGTSIYPADRVVPMLPPVLSNGICSLNPGEDRLAISCIMVIDGAGEVSEHKITPSVIHSREKMTYEVVNELVANKNASARLRYEGLVDMLDAMRDLSEILRAKRDKRGAIGFDFPEAKIVVDADGWPTAIRRRPRNTATGMIEEFMLAANETVAEAFFWLETPFVYRSHEEPDPDKLMRLRETLACFSYTLKGRRPGSIQALLAKATGTPEEHIISRMVLQSLNQARYTPQSLGHFGLAAKHYCHFTSPIRRYPDLQTHRIIKEYLAGALDEARAEDLNRRLPDICANCSRTERAAEAAERDVAQLKKAQYMSDKVGRVYKGLISGMHGRGIYVELSNTVEGMVLARALEGDRFVFDQSRMCYRGAFTKKTYTVGDRVKVRCTRVSIQAREIDFVFC